MMRNRSKVKIALKYFIRLLAKVHLPQSKNRKNIHSVGCKNMGV